jgi:hypothetical protein
LPHNGLDPWANQDGVDKEDRQAGPVLQSREVHRLRQGVGVSDQEQQNQNMEEMRQYLEDRHDQNESPRREPGDSLQQAALLGIETWIKQVLDRV